MSQLSQISGRKEKKTGIIHKQSLKRDDTRNLTFCDYYCFCRKFYFVLALKSDEIVESLCSGKVCIWRENVIFMKVPRGRIQKIQIAVAGKLASYMDSFYFAAVIIKMIQKSTEKGGGGDGGAPRPSSKSAHGPQGVLQSCHPDGYSTASSISCILSIPNLDSIFFRSLLPSVPRLNIFPFGF